MERITDLSQLDLTKQYTYADYLTWWFDDRVELFKGYIHKMVAPRDKHQKVLVSLSGEIYQFIEKYPCQLRVAPYDVRLQRNIDDTKVTTVVQPDICIICSPEIIDERGCNGAPDAIIEILSPSNRKRDIKDKYELYEEAGVKEYWIVYSEEKSINVFLLEEGKYKLDSMYADDGMIPVKIIDGLAINLEEIFDF